MKVGGLKALEVDSKVSERSRMGVSRMTTSVQITHISYKVEVIGTLSDLSDLKTRVEFHGNAQVSRLLHQVLRNQEAS